MLSHAMCVNIRNHLYYRKLTCVGIFWTFNLGMRKTVWVKSRIPQTYIGTKTFVLSNISLDQLSIGLVKQV